MDAQTLVALVIVAGAAAWLVHRALHRPAAAAACRDCAGCAPPALPTASSAPSASSTPRPGAHALPGLQRPGRTPR